jgi:hypothetical protein
MRRRLRARAVDERAPIPFSKMRVRLFKARALLRLGRRRLRRIAFSVSMQ